MTHRFLLFPAGAPGAGLLVLRLSVALFLLSFSLSRFPSSSLPALGLELLAIVISVGFRTRIAAAAGAIVAMTTYFTANGEIISMIAHGLDAIVLVMVGPGAFSVDARLFGRTTVHLVD